MELVWLGLLLCFVYTFFYNVVVLIHLLIRWLVRTDTVQCECFLLFVFLLLLSIVKIKISNCLLHSFSSFNEIYSGQNDRLFLMCQFKLCPFLQISHGCCSIHSCIYHWRNHGNGWFLVWYGQHLWIMTVRMTLIVRVDFSGSFVYCDSVYFWPNNAPSTCYLFYGRKVVNKW